MEESDCKDIIRHLKGLLTFNIYKRIILFDIWRLIYSYRWRDANDCCREDSRSAGLPKPQECRASFSGLAPSSCQWKSLSDFVSTECK